MTDKELGWVAGIIEGEGTICASTAAYSICPYIQVSMCDEDVVSKLRLFTKIGNVRKRSYNTSKGKEVFVWTVHKRENVIQLLELIWDLISFRRKEQIKFAWAKSQETRLPLNKSKYDERYNYSGKYRSDRQALKRNRRDYMRRYRLNNKVKGIIK